MRSRGFSLEAVLKLRAGAKERAEEMLAGAMRTRDAARTRSAEADAAHRNIAEELSGERFSADSRQRGWQAMRRQHEICEALREEAVAAECDVERLRVALVRASIDHELVLRLKQKWQCARARAQERAEERQLEEFVMARRTFHPSEIL